MEAVGSRQGDLGQYFYSPYHNSDIGLGMLIVGASVFVPPVDPALKVVNYPVPSH